MGSILYGYDLGVIAEVVASPSFTDLFNPTAAETYVLATLLSPSIHSNLF